MVRKRTGFVFTAFATALAWSAGSVAAPAQEGPPLTDLVDATVVDIDESARELTVRFEENRETATFDVAEDAKFYTYNGIQDVPVPFHEITQGDPVMLDFEDLEGERVLAMVTRRTDS